MTDADGDSKNPEERKDSKRSEEPKIRTDGGEVDTQNPGNGTSGVEDGPPVPQQPDVPRIGGRPDPGETSSTHHEDTHSMGIKVGDLPDSVETHFTPAELQRLQRIAASTNTKSAWVIKRLFRNAEE